MSLSISCRVAIKTDLPEILHLYSHPEMDDGKVLPLLHAEVIFERMEHYPDYKLFVAVYKEKIVGTFALLIMDNLGHRGAPSAIIEDIVVDPVYQRRGVGKTMMEYALDLAEQAGCYKAMLSSNLKRKRSHIFYESLGFRRHGYSFSISIQPCTPPDSAEPHR
jgi:GNAT superfamily N-acetyltransferase